MLTVVKKPRGQVCVPVNIIAFSSFLSILICAWAASTGILTSHRIVKKPRGQVCVSVNIIAFSSFLSILICAWAGILTSHRIVLLDLELRIKTETKGMKCPKASYLVTSIVLYVLNPPPPPMQVPIHGTFSRDKGKVLLSLSYSTERKELTVRVIRAAELAVLTPIDSFIKWYKEPAWTILP